MSSLPFESIAILLIALLPLFFAFNALIATSSKRTGLSPNKVNRITMRIAFANILIAGTGSFAVYYLGVLQSSWPILTQLGITIRLDPLSMLMFTMIALLGYIILRFSCNYLEGDARHKLFMGRLSATIAAVQLLVLAGDLVLLFVAWVLTSIALNKLLTFYPDRPRAIIASKKKFIVARLGDLSLLIGFILLYSTVGTTNLESIFSLFNSGQITINAELQLATICIALAALLKSAQFPTHSWLIEVMETPTPVSALLHAGLLNAGPFLIARMGFVMVDASAASGLLIFFGGLTALYGSVIFLTQSSVKTALGYSSIAHMGFMLLVCGMGVYSAAMLHLVAHSFYKAHAFLSSGSAVESLKQAKIETPPRTGSPTRILMSLLFSIGVYLGLSTLWGLDPFSNIGLFATGLIIIMGLWQLSATAIDSNGIIKGVLTTILLTLLVGVSFFALEFAMHIVLASQIPAMVQPGIGLSILISAIIIIYGLIVLIQVGAPSLSSRPVWNQLYIHIKRGFYVSTLFDRLVGSLKLQRHTRSKSYTISPLLHQQLYTLEKPDLRFN